jgi:hypothetical protein
MSLPAKASAWVLGVALSLFFVSCEEPGQIDLSDNPTDNVQLAIQELPLTASQVILDSIPTNGGNRLVMGRFRDAIFGEVSSSSYIQLGLRQSGNPVISPTAVYDSIRLILPVSSFHGIEFHSPQEFTAYELDEDLVFGADYFGNSSVAVKPEPIGFFRKSIVPTVDSLISIPISDEIGRDLFNKLQAGATEVATSPAFRQYFKGIFVEAGMDNNALYTFDLTTIVSRLSIFYHTETDNLQYSFTPAGNIHFNTLQQNRSGSVLEGITAPRTNFEPGTGRYYTHAGIGNLTKLNFSPILDFFDGLGIFKLNLAELEIMPVVPAGFAFPPPASLLFYYTDAGNNLLLQGSAVGAIQTDGFNQLGTGNNLRAFYDRNNNVYKASITGYLQAILDGSLPFNEVFVIPTDIGSSINRMEVPIEDFRLTIYYTVIND